jgi:hypothetical protein
MARLTEPLKLKNLIYGFVFKQSAPDYPNGALEYVLEVVKFHK